MPVGIPNGLTAPLVNVALALPAHVSVGLSMVTPVPASAEDNIVAVLFALSTSWADDLIEKATSAIKAQIALAYRFIWMEAIRRRMYYFNNKDG